MSSIHDMRRHALAVGLAAAALAAASAPAASLAQPASRSVAAASARSQKMIPPLLIAVNRTSVHVGRAIKVIVTVQNPDNIAAHPTGVVNIFDGSTFIGSAPLRKWQAKFSAMLPAGEHSLSAEYDGDANYEGTESSGIDVTVNP
jgi:large repetitive protein